MSNEANGNNAAGGKAPSLTVASIMTANVHGISPEMTIREAISLLLEHHIGGAPVVDSAKKVMSVVSEGDLLRLAASQGLDKTIQQCMTKLVKREQLQTVRKTDAFAEVYKKFLHASVHRLIVTDDMGRLEGIVSRSNVLRVLAKTSVAAPEKGDAKTDAKADGGKKEAAEKADDKSVPLKKAQ